jgi:hypothetical protein
MGRPKTQPVECVECGGGPTVARGLCDRCYQRRRKSGLLPKDSIPEVRAETATLDTHPDAPTGQRLGTNRCPVSKHDHIVSWGAHDAEPGLKQTTCRDLMSANGRLVKVLAPALDVSRSA